MTLDDPGTPVLVARYHYRHEGEFARQVLEDSGIDSALQVDDAGGADMGMAFVRMARLYVRPGDVERAREALEGVGLRRDEGATGEGGDGAGAPDGEGDR